MATHNIDVMATNTSSTPISTLIKTLCESSCEIRNNICSLLSKSDFNDIIVSDMCGQGKNKVTKQYLVENIIHLTNTIDNINNTLNPVFKCQTLSDALNNICDSNNNQLQLDIKSQQVSSSVVADAVDMAMKQHKIDIELVLDRDPGSSPAVNQGFARIPAPAKFV